MADAYFMAFNSGGGNLSCQLDAAALMGIVSLLVRLHEPYWEVMQACKEIIGSGQYNSNLELTDSGLVQASNQSSGRALTAEEAQEMLWSSDWRFCGRGQGKTLGLPEMAAAITATFNRSAGPLPQPAIDGSFAPMDSQPSTHAPEDGQDYEILSYPSMPDFSPGLKWDAFVADAARAEPTSLGEASRVCMPAAIASLPESSKHLVDHLGHAVELSPEPSHKDAWARGNAGDRSHRTAAKHTRRRASILDSLPEPQSLRKMMLQSARSALIAISTLALVLEPIVSGPESDQTEAETSAWLVLEACITAALTVEFLVRLVKDVQELDGFRTSYVRVVWLMIEALSALPLYMELIAEPIGDGFFYDGLKDGAALFRVARLARVGRFGSKSTLAAPIATMLVIVWGIYVKHGFSGK
mmetsp:Transcript_56159/g.133840  ORF Transcript_56159/g.133840 Transcript_56159/m.133840 type:complete len:413 (+) Transcript_56159:2-1240(+)